MSLLQVASLSKAFGGVQALSGVSFSLHKGELLALIGPNGAGKSTLFNLLGGQLVPDSGSVRLLTQPAPGQEAVSRELAGLPPRAIWRFGVGRTFQVAQTFSSLSVVENVQMALLSAAGRVFTWWRPAASFQREQALALLEQVGMQVQADRACNTLAYGDIKRVELAMALAHSPQLLLMDEPTAGMAPAERIALMDLTRELAKRQQIGVLFTEHSMDVVFGHADRVLVLVRGRLLAGGSPQEIQRDARVQQAYLGTGQMVKKR